MLAPTDDKDLAIPKPIPLTEPVTNAVLPLRKGVNIYKFFYRFYYILYGSVI
jgi:hypothetical protein